MKTTVLSVALLACVAGSASASPDETAYNIGGGLSYAPRYAGSKDDRVAPQLVGSAHFNNGIFVDLAQGVGYEAPLGQHWVVTTSVGFDPGRQDKDDAIRPGSDFLKGMGDIHQAALGNLGVTYRFGDAGDISVIASKALGHSYGATVHLQGRWVGWQRDHDSIEVAGSLDYGNRDYTQTYFGVTAKQAVRSRFTPFEGRAGLYAEQASVAWTHAWGPHLSSRLSVGATHYASTATNSPLVQKTNALGGAYAMVYRF